MGLKVKPAELLDNLAIETKEYETKPGPKYFNASYGCCYLKMTAVDRTYKDTDRERAKRILDMVGKVAFESSDRIGYTKSLIPQSPATPHPSKSSLKNGLLTLVIGWALCLILKRREFMYVLSNRGAVRDATYYLWGKGYAYYLSLGQTISAKATAAVGIFGWSSA